MIRLIENRPDSRQDPIAYAVETFIAGMLETGLTVHVDLGAKAALHRQNLGSEFDGDGLPTGRAPIGDLQDLVVHPGLVRDGLRSTARGELHANVALGVVPPRDTYTSFERWLVSESLAAVCGVLSEHYPGRTDDIKAHVRRALEGALTKRRPVIERYHQGRPGTLTASFSQLLNQGSRGPLWQRLESRAFRLMGCYGQACRSATAAQCAR